MLRKKYLNAIKERFLVNPVVALLGPRQCGKTTIARQFSSEKNNVKYFDLENPRDQAALEEPMLALEDLRGMIVIDEIQRSPHLFPVLRVLVDQHKDRKFLILGSASRELISQSSETLAGRISYLECSPFAIGEVTKDLSTKSIYRGGFPKSLMAFNDKESYMWREDYIKTFLEQDIPNLGIRIPPNTMRKFWMMLTHYHGQIFNSSDLGKSLGVAHTTTRRYLDILTGTFMIRELPPWIANISKRQIKMPKIYFRDSGVYLSLLGISDYTQLESHPKLGATWEGFAMEQVIKTLNATSESCFFWGVHQQSELDLLLFLEGKKLGFEFKYQDAPKLTKSMTNALEILELDSMTVIYPGNQCYKLSNDIEVVGLNQFIETNELCRDNQLNKLSKKIRANSMSVNEEFDKIEGDIED